MRIGLVNVTRLSMVQRTFERGWRIFIIITLLLLVGLWWMAMIGKTNVTQVWTDDRIRLRTLILAAVLLPTLIVALFRRNDFARLIFAVAAVSIIFLLAPILLMAVYGIATTTRLDLGDRVFALVFLLLIALALGWDFLCRPSYVLFLSLMPFTRLKVYRGQVVNSLLLMSGRWKSPEAERVEEGGEKLHVIPGVRYRQLLGVGWFILGSLCFALAWCGFMSDKFLPAIFHLEFIKAWRIVRHFEIKPGDRLLDAGLVFLVFILGAFCFFVFGYFRTQWQRENTIIFKVPISQHMTPADILLLRSWKDDVKQVARPSNNIFKLPFNIYGWVFTFEQLIVDRLRYLGKVRLLDIEQDKSSLLTKWEQTRFAKFLGLNLLRSVLTSILPGIWYKLPAKGGLRYYVGSEDWPAEVAKAMSVGRMVFLVLGTTESLQREMTLIAQLQCLEKTVFMMPPLILKKNYRVRWEQFIHYLNENRFIDSAVLKKVNPKRVLAVCVRGDALIVITGNRSSQLFYESAVDVATLFTVLTSAQSSQLIHQYLT